MSGRRWAVVDDQATIAVFATRAAAERHIVRIGWEPGIYISPVVWVGSKRSGHWEHPDA